MEKNIKKMDKTCHLMVFDPFYYNDNTKRWFLSKLNCIYMVFTWQICGISCQNKIEFS